jgi:hypothetical protein
MKRRHRIMYDKDQLYPLILKMTTFFTSAFPLYLFMRRGYTLRAYHSHDSRLTTHDIEYTDQNSIPLSSITGYLDFTHHSLLTH